MKKSQDTAREMFEAGDIVWAQWFSGKKLEYGRFAPAAIKLVRKTDEDAPNE